MKHKSKRRKHPKTRLRLPDLEFSRTAVLNSLTSVDGQRGYPEARFYAIHPSQEPYA